MSDDTLCPWCALPLYDGKSEVVTDHIIPRAWGGPSTTWNRQRMHRKCNGRAGKGATLIDEAVVLAILHGVVLHEPLRGSWPGCGSGQGSRKTPNPYRLLRGKQVSHAYRPGPPVARIKLPLKGGHRLTAVHGQRGELEPPIADRLRTLATKLREPDVDPSSVAIDLDRLADEMKHGHIGSAA